MKYAPLTIRSGPVFFGAFIAASLFITSSPQAASRRVMLPSGSVIPVRLDRNISSKSARYGDRFIANVRYGSDDSGLPEGSSVQGYVKESRRSAKGNPGILDVEFDRLVTPGGQNLAITGSLIALDSKSVKSSNSGRITAKSAKNKDRLKFVGIGTGAGLLIGSLTKSNRITGALLGAGAGYLANEFSDKEASDVNLKAGTEFGIRLDRQFAFDTNREYDNRVSAIDDATARTYREKNDDLSNEWVNSSNSNESSRRWIPSRERYGGANSYPNGDDIRMRIDNRNVVFGSAKPFMRGGQTLIPLDAVAQSANLSYNYDSQRKMISIGRDGGLQSRLNSRNAYMNGENRKLPVASEIRNGALYVSVQLIGMATGGSVVWNSAERMITLRTD